MKTIANRQATQEEIRLAKEMGTVSEAQRRIINAGGFPLFQRIITNPMYLDDLLRFDREYVPTALNYTAFSEWLRENKLEKFLDGGSFEKQLKLQEKFYQKFYGEKFRIDRKKIFVDARRLPAIKAGLEAGCLNYALLKVMPNVLTEAEMRLSRAEFAYERFVKPFKKEGFKIWAETGTDRWTKLTLGELLRRCVPVEPEQIDGIGIQNNWVAELKNAIREASFPEVEAGSVEIVFTSNSVDIPADQKIVNKNGDVVEPKDRSYVSVIVNYVRVQSLEEWIILVAQRYALDKTYLASNTWELGRDLVDHGDKNTSPPVSIASANSSGSGLRLDSDDAGRSRSYDRLRLAL